MPALTGEPFRGLTKIVIRDTVSSTPRRSYTLSLEDVTPDTATGDQVGTGATSWTQTPITPGEVISVTVRFEWDTIGSPVWDQANIVQIQARVPGGGNIGLGFWDPVGSGEFSGNSGVATRTLRFDSDPIDVNTSAARWGDIELHLLLERFVSPATVWTVDSRGAISSPPAGTTHDWARGYLRREGLQQFHSISNVSLGGAEPAVFAFPDTVFTRVTMDAQAYENLTLKAGLRNVANTEERNSSTTGTGPNFDFTWNGTGGTNGANRIAEGMTLASELKDLRLDITAADFGGDNKFIFAGTGHQTGFSRTSELVLQDDDRITVDPRLTWVYHMQFDANDFATPPTSHANTATTEGRLTSQLAFLVARVINARGEGQNGITVTRPFRDANNLVADEAGDTVTTVTRGGQDGWEPSFAVWDAALPAGTWTRTQTITSPADATDLDTNPTKNYTLLAADPRIVLVVGGGPTSKGSHAVPGEPFQVGLSAFRAGERKLLAVDSDGAGGHKAYVGVIRLQDSGAQIGRAEYLEADGLTWTPITDVTTMSAIYMHQCVQSRPNSAVYTKTFSAGQTTGWGTYDIFTVGECSIGGTPYAEKYKEIVVDVHVPHTTAIDLNHNLDFHSDVNTSGADASESLVYSGTEWTPALGSITNRNGSVS